MLFSHRPSLTGCTNIFASPSASARQTHALCRERHRSGLGRVDPMRGACNTSSGAQETMAGDGVVFLFDDFETLDAFGPVEVLGGPRGKWNLLFWSIRGGAIRSRHGALIQTDPIPLARQELDFFLIPGGPGTRGLAQDDDCLMHLRTLSEWAAHVLTVCTGSALLAAAGVLDGKRATSNKMAFDWVRQQGNSVDWLPSARWVVDGKFYTSSGVSAGIDMSLAFVQDTLGHEWADRLATGMEYAWNSDPSNDPFAADAE